jgi:hypothetical protein
MHTCSDAQMRFLGRPIGSAWGHPLPMPTDVAVHLAKSPRSQPCTISAKSISSAASFLLQTRTRFIESLSPPIPLLPGTTTPNEWADLSRNGLQSCLHIYGMPCRNTCMHSQHPPPYRQLKPHCKNQRFLSIRETRKILCAPVISRIVSRHPPSVRSCRRHRCHIVAQGRIEEPQLPRKSGPCTVGHVGRYKASLSIGIAEPHAGSVGPACLRCPYTMHPITSNSASVMLIFRFNVAPLM